MPSSTRGYSAGKFAFELEGAIVGFVDSVEGGEAVGDVVEDPIDGNGIIPKRIGEVRFEPITVTFAGGMGDEFYAWITEVADRIQRARDGAILFLDYNFSERSRMQFSEAFISEITFPAFDAASKDVARFGVTMDAQDVSVTPSNGTRHSGFGTKTQKGLRPSNFRFKLDGLPTNRVTKVEVPKLTQKISTDDAGSRVPGPLMIPNVRFEVAETDAQPFIQWAQDVLMDGNTAAAERNGSIELLDPSFKDALFTIQFFNLGIVRVSRQRTDARASVIAKLGVELYCESMSFSPAADAVGEATAAAPTTKAASAPSVAEALITELEGTATSVGIERAVRLLQRESLATAQPEARARLVAARLESTAPVASSGQTARREDGETLGERWAAEFASLAELEQMAALEQGEWTAIRLGEEHSLLRQMASTGAIPVASAGLELERDAFAEGVIAGAARVLRLASPHLGTRSEAPGSD
jgi:hypothetical protein